MSEQIVRQMKKCYAVAFFCVSTLHCTCILHLCEEHIFGFTHTHSKWTTIIMRFWYLHSFACWNCKHRFSNCSSAVDRFWEHATLVNTKFHVEHNKSWQWEIQTNDIIYTKPNGTHTLTHTHIPYTCYDVNWMYIKNWFATECDKCFHVS